MSKKIILLAIFSVLSTVLIVQQVCHCERIVQFSKHPERIIDYLEISDLDYRETVTNENVEEILEATYFYCKGDHGYLYIKLDDKEKLYKDVPLDVWFEFKFHETMDSFYRSEITYNFLTV